MSEGEGEGEVCHKEIASNGPALFQNGDFVFQGKHTQ